jgi:hypothetical protein
MAQAGNMQEMMETAHDGTNDLQSELRAARGGTWAYPGGGMESYDRSGWFPDSESNDFGFRVASVPEPSTYALLAMTAAGALWWARRRR